MEDDVNDLGPGNVFVPWSLTSSVPRLQILLWITVDPKRDHAVKAVSCLATADQRAISETSKPSGVLLEETLKVTACSIE